MTELQVAQENLSAPTAPPMAPSKRGRWIEHWRPDDEVFWSQGGETIARKNLVLSMFAEHVGFSVWVLWTVVV